MPTETTVSRFGAFSPRALLHEFDALRGGLPGAPALGRQLDDRRDIAGLIVLRVIRQAAALHAERRARQDCHAVVGLLAAASAWYAYSPELLEIDRLLRSMIGSQPED